MPDDRAQSESIGVILLTGAVVIASAGAGAVILTIGAGGSGGPTPLADLGIDVAATNLTVEHRGGDAIAFDESAVLVRSESADYRYAIDAANVTGDTDDRFEPGERFERAHGVSDDTVSVVVVDTDANEVLARASLDVPSP